MRLLLSVFDSPESNTAGSLASSFVSSTPKPPIPPVITMSSLGTTSSSLTYASVPAGTNDTPGSGVAGYVGNPPEPGSTAASAVTLDETAERVSSVWEFDHIQKNGTTALKGSQTWTCLWCNQTFKQWNATKVLYHLVKMRGHDVRTCRANHDAKHKELYQSLLKEKDKSQAGFEARAANFQAVVGDGQQSLAIMFEAGRQRISNGGSTAIATARSRVMGTDLTVEASTASQLTMSIADFIHSSGLSFSATQGQHFQNILKFARGVPANYKPPSRNSIATTLLKINYNRRIEK